MIEEIKVLEENQTYELTFASKLKKKKVIGCKQVYKVKHNPIDTIEYYKAHLVVKGL